MVVVSTNKENDMATLKNINVGQTLWSVRKHRMGNTNISTESLYQVVVKSIDLDGGFAVCSWNGNPDRKYHEQELAKLKVKKPQPKHKGALGSVRY